MIFFNFCTSKGRKKYVFLDFIRLKTERILYFYGQNKNYGT